MELTALFIALDTETDMTVLEFMVAAGLRRIVYFVAGRTGGRL